jgi:autophagy-related protein 5
MDNTSLRRAVWNGSIPCRIELDPAESRVFDAAGSYFVSALTAWHELFLTQ